MRAAIRGDFERLAERRGSQELMQVSDDEVADDVEPAEPPAIESEPAAPTGEQRPRDASDEPTHEPGTTPKYEGDASAAKESDSEGSQAPRRGFLARLLSLD